MKQLVCLLLVLSVLSSCTSDDAGPVNIRLHNNSVYSFEDIQIGSLNSYGDLDSGEFSGYQEFEKAYRYAFVELMIDGEIYTLQPIDFVGETPLKGGFYTYQLDANDSQERYGKLGITLVEN